MSTTDTSQIEQQEPQAPAEAPEPPIAALTREELFRWQAYVHVGEGATECDFAKAVSAADHKQTDTVPLCADPGHFHAWIRLPNPFQVRDIEEKARAAQARKMRALRDPDSDAAVVLEDELESVRDSDQKTILIHELLESHFQEDYMQAVNEVMEIEGEPVDDDDEAPKLYGSIDQDVEELARQDALPEDERDEDYEHLQRHVQSYRDAVDEHYQQLRGERERSLEASEWDTLLDSVRKRRREQIATEAYLHTFSMWQWYVCTFKPKRLGTPTERVFGHIDQMRLESAPEVAVALRQGFDDLQRGLAMSRRAKNS